MSARYLSTRARRARRGLAMLMVLIVAGIILILLLNGPLKQAPVTRKTQIEQNIQRADKTSVMMNIRSMETELQMMKLTNPDRQFTTADILERLQPKASGSGGVYYLAPDGKIYHTGFPELAPPPELLAQMIAINAEPDPAAADPANPATAPAAAPGVPLPANLPVRPAAP